MKLYEVLDVAIEITENQRVPKELNDFFNTWSKYIEENKKYFVFMYYIKFAKLVFWYNTNYYLILPKHFDIEDTVFEDFARSMKYHLESIGAKNVVYTGMLDW